MATTNFPKPSDRFKPRAQNMAYRLLLRAAWDDIQSKPFDPDGRRKVAAAVANHLRGLFPYEDIMVLDRYGLVEKAKDISVRIWNPATSLWDQTSRVTFEDEFVPIPTNFAEVYVGGPRFSTMPNYGCTDDYWASLSEPEKDRMRHYHEKAERERLPADLEPWFAAIVETYATYRQHRDSFSYPLNFFHQYGRQPTWGEIEAAIPFLGDYMKAQREKRDAK